jgi:hypothetical protein
MESTDALVRVTRAARWPTRCRTPDIFVGDGLVRRFPPDEPEHPTRAGERTNVHERRAEPQLRFGQGLTTEAGGIKLRCEQ